MWYFGFGANASPKMIHTLLGRVPKSERAILKNYRLYIQPWKAIPLSARSTLIDSWTPCFRCYVIRPKRGSSVEGKIWHVTEREKKILDEWDMADGRWTESVPVLVTLQGGSYLVAEVPVCSEWNDQLIIASELQPFLNPITAMYRAGTKVRNYIAKI